MHPWVLFLLLPFPTNIWFCASITLFPDILEVALRMGLVPAVLDSPEQVDLGDNGLAVVAGSCILEALCWLVVAWDGSADTPQHTPEDPCAVLVEVLLVLWHTHHTGIRRRGNTGKRAACRGYYTSGRSCSEHTCVGCEDGEELLLYSCLHQNTSKRRHTRQLGITCPKIPTSCFPLLLLLLVVVLFQDALFLSFLQETRLLPASLSRTYGVMI